MSTKPNRPKKIPTPEEFPFEFYQNNGVSQKKVVCHLTSEEAEFFLQQKRLNGTIRERPTTDFNSG